jgi:hypothetical protein
MKRVMVYHHGVKIKEHHNAVIHLYSEGIYTIKDDKSDKIISVVGGGSVVLIQDEVEKE